MNGQLWSLVLILLPISISAQTVALPEKTGWIIHHKGKQTKIQEDVLYVGIFDSQNLAPFYGFKEMGVLNQNGEVLFRTETKIEALDYGYFLLGENRLLHIADGQVSEKQFKLRDNYERWLIGLVQDEIVAINKASAKQIKLNLENHKVIGDYMCNHTPSSSFLYDLNGNLVDSTSLRSYNPFETANDYCYDLSHVHGSTLIWFTPRKKLLLLDNKKVNIDKAKSITVLSGYLEIVETNKVHLLNLKTKRITITTPGEMLRPINSEFLLFRVNGKAGLLNNEGKVLIPAEYDNVTVFKQYVLVQNAQLTGLYNRDFVKILDCKYTRIEPRYNFYYTQKFGGRGLVSRKTNKEILAPVYDQILIKDNKIKAWLGNQMRIFVINDMHQIVEEFIVNDVVSVDKANYNDAKIDFDSRLFQIGWFHVSREVKTELGGINHRLLWGIKNDKDSVILKPSLSIVRYVHESPVSLFPLPESDNKFYRYSFGAIDNSTGKVVPKLVILDIDTNDFQTREFARFSAPDLRHGILKRDGRFTLYAYVDRGDASILRVCKMTDFKLINSSVNNENCEPIINANLNSPQQFTKLFIDKKESSHLMFEKAKWNFLNAAGDPIFAEDFEYAYPFVGSHAIVLTKTGYGVIDSSHFVVEPIYRSIKRTYFNGDTLFLVEQKPQGAVLFQFANGMLQNLEIYNVNIQKRHDMVTLLAGANKRHVVHEELGLLRDSLVNVKIYDHGYFVERIKSGYFIYNHEGLLLGETGFKPKQILNDELYVFQDKGILALCDFNGKISDLKYLSIVVQGEFVFAKSRLGFDVYDVHGRPLACDLEHIYLDPISGNLLYILNGKMFVVDQQFKVLSKMKCTEVVLGFVDDKIYLRYGKVLDMQGVEIAHAFGKFMSFEYLGSDVITFYTNSGHNILYDLNWQHIELSQEKLKNAKVISDDVIQYRSSGSTFLHNRSTGTTLSLADVYGGFQDGFICGRQHDGKYAYFNNELLNSFNISFLKAKPFRGGLAAVLFESGWGIINNLGLPELTPCLNEISVLSRDLVLSLAHSQLGIYDGLGRLVIPVEYDAISVQKDYIRTHNYGKIEIWDDKFRKILESGGVGR